MADKNKEYTDRNIHEVRKEISAIDTRLKQIEERPGDNIGASDDQSDFASIVFDTVDTVFESHAESRRQELFQICQANRWKYFANEAEFYNAMYDLYAQHWFEGSMTFKKVITNYNGLIDIYRNLSTSYDNLQKRLTSFESKLQSYNQPIGKSSTQASTHHDNPAECTPKGFFPRLRFRIHNWLNGSFAFHRGYTILFAILYSLLFLLACHFHITIS